MRSHRATSSEQPAKLADALRRLADDAPLRERLGKAARMYAEEHLAKDQVLTWSGYGLSFDRTG